MPSILVPSARFPYRSRRAKSIVVSVIFPSIYIAGPGSTLNFFSEILLIPGISIARRCSPDFFPGVNMKTSDCPFTIRSSEPLKIPAHSGISRKAREENQDTGISVTESTTCICMSTGSPHTFGGAERIILIRGFSIIRMTSVIEIAGSAMSNLRLISPASSFP